MLGWLLGWAIGIAVVLSAAKARRLLTQLLYLLLFAGIVSFILVDPFKHELMGVAIFAALQTITAAFGIVVGAKTYPTLVLPMAFVTALLMVLIPFAFIGYLGFPVGLIVGTFVQKAVTKRQRPQRVGR